MEVCGRLEAAAYFLRHSGEVQKSNAGCRRERALLQMNWLACSQKFQDADGGGRRSYSEKITG